IDYGPNSTRDYKIRKILEAQAYYRSPPRARPEVFHIGSPKVSDITPPPKRFRGSPSSSEISSLPPNRWKPSPVPSPTSRAQGRAEAAYIGSLYLPKPPPVNTNLAIYNLPQPPPIAVPPQTLVIPQTQTPENLRGASGSGAAAAAVERRPVPPGGLSLQILWDYSER
ncbi:MAG: hypothetical protein ACKPKO_18720, partial [Candidatus Fonsibacter sp.]